MTKNLLPSHRLSADDIYMSAPRRQVSALFVSRLISTLAQAVLLLALARLTGPSTFGLSGAIMAACGLIGLSDLGLQNLAMRLYSVPADRLSALRAMHLQRAALIAVCCTASGVMGLLVLFRVLPMWSILVPAWTCSERLMLADLAIHTAAGRSRIQLDSILLARIATSLLFVVLCISSVEAISAFWIAYLCGSTSTYLLVRALSPAYIRPSADERRSLIQQSLHFWKANMAATVRTLDLPIVAAVAGATQGGYYALPQRLGGPVNLAVDSVAAAAFPYARRRDMSAIATLTRAVYAVCGAIALGGVLAIVFARDLVVVFVGRSYLPAVHTVQIVIVALLIGLPEAYLTRLLQAWGHERAVGNIHVGLAVATLVLSPVGAFLGGAVGAGVGLVAISAIEAVALCVLYIRVRPGSAE